MSVEDVRERRRMRRSRRQTNPSPWGTGSLILGAGAVVAVYSVTRICNSQVVDRPSIAIEVTGTRVLVNGAEVLRIPEGVPSGTSGSRADHDGGKSGEPWYGGTPGGRTTPGHGGKTGDEGTIGPGGTWGGGGTPADQPGDGGKRGDGGTSGCVGTSGDGGTRGNRGTSGRGGTSGNGGKREKRPESRGEKRGDGGTAEAGFASGGTAESRETLRDPPEAGGTPEDGSTPGNGVKPGKKHTPPETPGYQCSREDGLGRLLERHDCLTAQLIQAASGRRPAVVLRAERGVPYATVQMVLRAIEEAGLGQPSFDRIVNRRADHRGE